MKAEVMKFNGGYDVVMENGYIIPFSSLASVDQIVTYIEQLGPLAFEGGYYDKEDSYTKVFEFDVDFN